MFDKVLNTTLSKDFSLHKKMKFSIKDFFSKYDQIHWKLLLKNSLMENFNFRAVYKNAILQNTF